MELRLERKGSMRKAHVIVQAFYLDERALPLEMQPHQFFRCPSLVEAGWRLFKEFPRFDCHLTDNTFLELSDKWANMQRNVMWCLYCGCSTAVAEFLTESSFMSTL
ncbi:hypothetical protein GQX74_004278 [Glossina fuscipes]|nr:hypothetical protein GQX74_004278 [Glossina fuscipes]